MKGDVNNMRGEIATSLGVVGVISYDRPNQRAKGVLKNPFNKLNALVDELSSQLINLSPHFGDITRITTRVFTSGNLTADNIRNSLDGQVTSPIHLTVDAVIPLTESKNGINSIVYLGGNRNQRIQSQKIIEEDLNFVQEAQRLSQELQPNELPTGYTQHLAIDSRNISEQDIKQVLIMYQSVFKDYVVELNENTVRKMFDDNIVGLVRNKDDKIISLTMAEVVPSVIDNITLIELTDSATDPNLKEEDPAVKNINFWARQILIDYLQENMPGTTVLYSEARADLISVLRNNFWQGFQFAGLLPNSCRMKSDITSSRLNRGEYGDLAVMYLIINNE